MKRLLTLTIICCFAGILSSCQKDTDNTNKENNDITNPIVGTTWEWHEDPITWTFTFSEEEVTFDYRAEFSPNDITTDQYKSTYTYTSNKVVFEMTGWSDIVWKYTGTIDGDSMHLVDSGTESIDIVLTKK